jgi:transglutaminase-like putative cysteine protease
LRDLFLSRNRLLLAAALGALAAGLMLADYFLGVLPSEAPSPIRRQVQYSFTLQNFSPRELKHAEFWAPAPVGKTAHQTCERLEVSHPHQLISDEHGNQTLYFRLPEMPPFSTVIVSVKATLALSDTPQSRPVAEPTAYLGPEPFCESQAPQIVRLAESFSSRKPAAVAEEAFHWTAANVRYAGYLRHERGALYALMHRQGDCTEFMYLFAALCRAKGIPARTIGGFVCTGNTALTPEAYHNWVEFFDGRVWRLADPQRKGWMKHGSRYIAMKVIGETANDPMAGFQRFRFKGEGLKVKMNS